VAITIQEESPNPAPTLINRGTISVTNDSGVTGIYNGASGFYDAGLFLNEASGIFRVTSTGGAAAGFLSPSWSINITNQGLFEVTGATDARGVTAWDSSFIFINTGTLRVAGGGAASGVTMENGGSFNNSGLIEVSGGQGALGVAYGSTGVFINSGTLRVTTTSANYAAVGVWIEHLQRQFCADRFAESVDRFELDSKRTGGQFELVQRAAGFVRLELGFGDNGIHGP
jgi:hypothetical protein